MKKAYGNIVKYSKLIRIRTDYGTASLKLFHDTKREDIIAEIYEATKTPKDKNFYLVDNEGNRVVISSSLPEGIEFQLKLVEEEDLIIYIQTLSGKTKQITIKSFNTIENIKNIIYEELSIPIKDQILTYNGFILENDKKIDYYNIVRDSVLILLSL